MNTRKSTAVLKPLAVAVSIAAALALSACGGGGGDDNGGTTTPPPSNGGNNTPTTAVLGYIAQAGATNGTGRILKCTQDTASGALTCAANTADTTTTTLAAPAAIAFNSAKTFAYVLNTTGTGDPTISRCAVGTAASGGTVSACAPQAGANELANVIDIGISGNNFYTLKAGQVLQCNYDTNGVVGSCGDAGIDVTGLNAAESFAFANNRVWIANSGGAGFVRSCAVTAATGAIAGCTDAWTAPSTDLAPFSIAFNSDASIAYLALRDANSGAGGILKCTASGSGTLTSCDAQPTTLPAATGDAQVDRIAVKGNYVYVTRSSSTAANNSVTKCTIGTGGAITASTCASAVSGTSPFTGEITDVAF